MLPPLPILMFAAANPLLDTRFLIAVGGLVFVLLAGAVAFFFAEQWKRRQLSSDDHDTAESLTEYRRMFEQGQLSRDEYERVRDRLAARLKGAKADGVGVTAVVESPGSQPDPEDGEGFTHGSDSPPRPGQVPPHT